MAPSVDYVFRIENTRNPDEYTLSPPFKIKGATGTGETDSSSSDTKLVHMALKRQQGPGPLSTTEPALDPSQESSILSEVSDAITATSEPDPTTVAVAPTTPAEATPIETIDGAVVFSTIGGGLVTETSSNVVVSFTRSSSTTLVTSTAANGDVETLTSVVVVNAPVTGRPDSGVDPGDVATEITATSGISPGTLSSPSPIASDPSPGSGNNASAGPGLSSGAIAGIAVGSAAAGVLAAAAVFFLVRRHYRNKMRNRAGDGVTPHHAERDKEEAPFGQFTSNRSELEGTPAHRKGPWELDARDSERHEADDSAAKYELSSSSDGAKR